MGEVADLWGSFVFERICYALRQSNGLTNAVVYALVSRFVRRERRRARATEERARGQEEDANRSAELSLAVSWNVNFATHDQVLGVAGVTAAANRTAEEETRSLRSDFGLDDSDADDDFLACFDV